MFKRCKGPKRPKGGMDIALILALVLVALVMFAATASAGVLGDTAGKLWGFVREELIGTVAILLIVWLKRKNKQVADKIANTLVEAGEASKQLGTAILSEDKRDAEKVVKEITDVYNIYKPTPARYQQ